MNDDDDATLSLIELTLCYGGATEADTHLLADIVAIDADILEVIAERERRRKREQKGDAVVVD